MANQSSNVNFTANTDQYTQALNAAIQITDQYSKAADTALGTVAKMGGGIVNKWVQGTSAVTQVNKTATAQAAAYQTKLTAIETTSKVLGDKSFPQLEKSVKSLAKQFPIGIDKAVEQYKTLQESGITVNKQVEKLAVSYTKLGAVTNTSGPDIGKQMTELTRGMGNSLDMVDGMGDSLTTLTKKFGGTASGVLSFSKSIAPIAATVGMSQTQVMGLSTAFSRMGEDGFAAGNAVNKVLLDMSHSVREGSPEVRAYAEALGMTVAQTKEMFKSDPSEMVTRFVESIQKAGPDAIRTLEGLGLEGVRTAKAFTSLAGQGNLREITEEASKAYGSGSMTAGAETAMGGVNDEMTKLNETMSQMVADSGKPFLNIMTGVLKQANSVSGVFSDIIASDIGQKLGGPGQILAGGIGAAVSGAGSIVSTAGMLGLGMRGVNFAKGQIGNVFAGQRAGVAANLGMEGPEEAGAATRLGDWAKRRAIERGAMDPATLAGAGQSFREQLSGRIKGGITGGYRTAKAGLTLGALATASDMRTAMGDESLKTDRGQQLKAEASAAYETFKSTGSLTESMKGLSPELKKLVVDAKNGEKVFGSTGRSMAELTKATGKMYLTSAKGTVSAGLGMLGGGIPAVGGAMAAGMAGTWAYSQYKEGMEKNKETVETAKANPFGSFNEFAEKAGYAAKNVSMLGEAAEKSAKTLLDAENTTMEAALTVSEKERTIAEGPGYEAAFASSGNAAADAARAVLMNPGASSQEVGRMVTDVTHTGGVDQGNAFSAAYGGATAEYEKDPMKFITEQVMGSSALSKGGWSGFKERTMGSMDTKGAEMVGAAVENLTQLYQEDAQKGGVDYAANRQMARAEELWKAGAASNDTGKEVYAKNTIAGILGIDPKEVQGMFGPAFDSFGSLMEEYLDDVQGSAGEKVKGTYEQYKTGDIPAMAEVFDSNRELLAGADKRTEKMTGTMINLTDVLSEGNDIAKEHNVSIDSLDDNMKKNMTPLGQAIAASQANPEDRMMARRAGQGFAEETLTRTKRAGGTAQTAQVALIQQLASAPQNQRQIIGSALNELQMNPQAIREQARQAPLEQIRQKIQTRNQLAAGPMPEAGDTAAWDVFNGKMAEGGEAIQQYEGMMMETMKSIRDGLKSMDRASQDFGRSQAHNRAQFNRQRKWAREDFNTQENIAERNFLQSQKWAQEDYNKTRRRATKEFQLNQQRANEDYQKSMLRAQEDFTLQMARGEQDYLKGRNRAFADHDKQLKRQIQDTAKSMYDPYQRVSHERVWSTRSLLGNMAEQEKLLQKQMAQIEKLKEMGVSQEAIDVLGLADPQKAQQLFKVYGDTLSDPTLIGELNATVTSRMGTAEQVATSENNVSYRRGEEDFGQSIQRMDEDYQTQVTRANEDFLTQMSRQHADFITGQERAIADFNLQMQNMATDYQTQMSRSKTQYDQQMGDAEDAFNKQMKRQKKTFDLDMAYAAEQFGTAQSRVASDMAKALTDMVDGYDSLKSQAATLMAKLPEDLRGPLKTAMNAATSYVDKELADHKFMPPNLEMDVTLNFKLGDDIKKNPSKYPPWMGGTADVYAKPTGGGPSGGGGGTAGSSTGGGSAQMADFFLDAVGDTVIKGMGHDGTVGYHDISGRCLQNVAWAKRMFGDHVVHTGFPSAASVTRAMQNEKRMHSGYGAPAGALYWWDSSVGSGYGHVATADGKGNAINNWGSNRIEKHPVASMSPRGYKGWTTYASLAVGGIVGRQTFANLGEGGFPEAVLPLNEKGANFVGDVLARYLPNDEAKTARVAPYASQVTVNNYTYDQSTKIQGPITVQSNDPDDMARQLAGKQRRDRLRQPVGSNR